MQRRGVGLVRDFGRLIEQREHLPHIDQRLTDFAIDGAKEVQGHGQLHHIGVDHNEIPHGKVTVLHPDGGQDHHADQPAGDQQRLAEVQEGKRVVRLDRRLFIARHCRVIALRLALFGDEILDGFIVQQAVDGLLVGIRVAVVHLAAQLHAPLGHREGKPDVKPDGDRHDQQIPRVEQHGQDDADQQQLQNQRPDREKQEAEQEFHTLDPAFDDPAQPAGFARDVIAHRQLVDMLERLQRKHPQSALADTGKDRVAQLLKAHVHCAGHPIGNRQPHRAKCQKRHALIRKSIHRVFVKHGNNNRNQLGYHQEDQRPDHAFLDPRHIVGPEVRGHFAQDKQVRLPLCSLGDLLFCHGILGGGFGLAGSARAIG